MKIEKHASPQVKFSTTYPVTIRDMQTLPLRSGHLDIKHAQRPKKNDGRKIVYYIKRVWAPRASKNSTLFESSQICWLDCN